VDKTIPALKVELGVLFSATHVILSEVKNLVSLGNHRILHCVQNDRGRGNCEEIATLIEFLPNFLSGNCLEFPIGWDIIRYPAQREIFLMGCSVP